MTMPLDDSSADLRANNESTEPFWLPTQPNLKSLSTLATNKVLSAFATNILNAAITDSTVTKFLTKDLDNPTDHRRPKFEVEVYKQNVVPNLINKVLVALNDTTSMRNEDIEKIKIFLSNDEKNPKFKEAFDFVRNTENTLQDRIALGRHLIHYTIPQSISDTIVSAFKRMDPHHGPRESDETEVDIPYKAARVAKTPKDTSFKDPYQTMLSNMIDSMRSKEIYKRMNEKNKGV